MDAVRGFAVVMTSAVYVFAMAYVVEMRRVHAAARAAAMIYLAMDRVVNRAERDAMRVRVPSLDKEAPVSIIILRSDPQPTPTVRFGDHLRPKPVGEAWIAKVHAATFAPGPRWRKFLTARSAALHSAAR